MTAHELTANSRAAISAGRRPKNSSTSRYRKYTAAVFSAATTIDPAIGAEPNNHAAGIIKYTWNGPLLAPIEERRPDAGRSSAATERSAWAHKRSSSEPYWPYWR